MTAIQIDRAAVGNARTLYEITGDIKDVNTLLINRAAMQSQAAPRTLLEQYDLDQSPEYRKGYEDGRLKGYEVGHRYATEALQSQAAAEPDRTGMTYYKNNACKADSAASADCICWTHQPTHQGIDGASGAGSTIRFYPQGSDGDLQAAIQV